MEEPLAGYREIEHTADWELHIWAPDFSGLLVQSARGMYALTLMQLENEPRVTRQLEIVHSDREGLLVDFLTELLFISEDEGLGFDTFELEINDDRFNAHLTGAPIRFQAKEIKAVTYHHLHVRETERRLEVNIVFDV